jgi:HEAT repeat protein
MRTTQWLLIIALPTAASFGGAMRSIAAQSAERDLKATYGGPMILKPKIARWGARMGVGEAFVGENGLAIGGWTLTNTDLDDCLKVVGFKDHDIVIGTGTVKRDGGEPVDLRVLDVGTPQEALALLESDDRVKRAKGAWALGQIGGEKDIPALKKALADSEWVVRRYALISLSQHLDLDQTTAVALASVGDKDGIVAVAAIRILQKKAKPDKQVLDALLSRIQDEGWTIAKAAIVAVGELGDNRALAPLRAALAKKPILTKDALAEAIKRIEGRQK